MRSSPKRAVGAAVAVLGLILSVLAIMAPAASAAQDNDAVPSCTSARQGASDVDLQLTTNPADGATVQAGSSIQATMTWGATAGNDDWASIDKLALCMFVDGAVDVNSILFQKPGVDDGSESTTFTVPQGAKEICVIGRVSGQPGPNNGSDTTHKSNENCFTVGTTVPSPSVSIAKTPVATSVASGSNIGYAITVTAGGTGTATDVTVTDVLPSGHTWSEDRAECDIAGTPATLSCDVGDMAAGTTFTVNISAPTTAGVCATVDNTATVDATNLTADPDDTDSTGNTITITGCTQTPPSPSVSIAKTPVATSVASGSNIGYAITVTAGGTGTSTGVTVSDVLPSGRTWSEDSDKCAITGAGAGTLNCAVGDMAAGATFTVNITAPTTAGVCATVDNTATVDATNLTADADDTDSTGNTITITGCTPPPPPVVTNPALSASAKCAAGGQLVTVTNTGDGPGSATVSNNGTVIDTVTVPAGQARTVLVPLDEDDAFVITVSGVTGSITGTQDCIDVGGVVIPRPKPDPAPVVKPVVITPAAKPATQVLGNVITRPRTLARTGSETLPLLEVGIGLLILGAGLTLSSRKDQAKA